MKINEILVESQLQEGPILNKIGSAIGKGAGTLAKGVGAVAGGVAGLGRALKKGFQAGKATVGGAGDDETPAAGGSTPAFTTTSAPGGGAPVAKTTAASAPTSGEVPATTTAPAAGGSAPVAKTAPAAKKTTAAPAAVPAANPKADTAYAQAQKAIAGLQPQQKKEIVTMLQADPKVKAAMTAKPKATKSAAPGAGAMGAMAGQLAKGAAAEPNTMANAPVSKTNKAKPGNPNAAQAADTTATPAPTKAATPGSDAAKDNLYGAGNRPKGAKEKVAALKKQNKKPAAPSQAEIDADRAKIMGVTSDSIIRTKPMMAESFSLFRKR